ncbi:MAG TPA: PQQ-dependent catabolism-associated CXXCW motif protein [Aliidongia sp.]|uniref:PQQ-dependent catabolism-associated CXXCW motif protein n=1 Tax=Aliidongia sp. TaxID=1914230 RepID=UPI002DDD08C6|nr:PQQ-dependent catabolism-associated CXXCW motif protein [Aliidongia sp.]HEV2677454.1 PQQ-dependent catabolism-associated CXXCW motif protein [Aliidongia sp.]
MTAAILAAPGPAPAGVPEPQGYRLDGYRAPVPGTLTGGHVVHTRELQTLLARGGALAIDVLPAPRRPDGMRPDQPWMPVPRRDIPDSLWLPDVGRGALAPALDAWFRDALAKATAGDGKRPLVFYCLSRCWMSWNAAKRAVRYGYRRVYWYPDGSDGWARAGLPLAQATPEPRDRAGDGQ